jgi:hypothetical protein
VGRYFYAHAWRERVHSQELMPVFKGIRFFYVLFMLSYTGMKITNEYYKSQKDTQHGVGQTLPINGSWYRSMVTSHGPGPLDRIADKIPYFCKFNYFFVTIMFTYQKLRVGHGLKGY